MLAPMELREEHSTVLLLLHCDASWMLRYAQELVTNALGTFSQSLEKLRVFQPVKDTSLELATQVIVQDSYDFALSVDHVL